MSEKLSPASVSQNNDDLIGNHSDASLDDTSSEGSSDAESEESVELLVKGRERRSTAGNLLSALLEQAEEEQAGDDDVELLFAPVEGEDEDFDGLETEKPSDDEEDASSSSEEDGEDEGDELAGEKQLQKEERAQKRSLKRKADKAFVKPQSALKKVRMADVPSDTQPAQPVERKRKKSERVSWIPTEEDAPVRMSSRALALENKERTIASIKESAEKRAKQIASMEAAQKRKTAERAKPMTQEEKLAEAARTERLNSKSLNKWEQMEKDRVSKQKARLDALHNRKLEGPVIRWYSGPATWVNGKFKHMGKPTKVEEIEEEESKKEAIREPEIALQHKTESTTINEQVANTANGESNLEEASNVHQHQTIGASQSAPQRLLDGIDFYASLPAEPTHQNQDAASSTEAPTSAPEGDQSVNQKVSQPSSNTPAIEDSKEQPSITHPHIQPLILETASINTLTLVNFDPAAARSLDIQRQIIFKNKNGARPIKSSQPMCAISALPAKYRDPLTGLPYRSIDTFRSIRSIVPKPSESAAQKILVTRASRSGPMWSNLLGAWVGNRKPARGVPEGFEKEKPHTASESKDAEQVVP